MTGRTCWAATLLLVSAVACHRGANTGAHNMPVVNPAMAAELRASEQKAKDAPARIPRDAARFPIARITDSTATIRLEEARWVRPGLPAWVVDASRGDALVARLRVVSRDSVEATALLLSQAAAVRQTHMLVVAHPSPSWWKRGSFWSGAAVGAAFGVGVGTLGR